MTAARDTSRIQTALASLRQPGTGYHGSLLGCSNTLIAVGLSPTEAESAIRAHTPADGRRVLDKEIHIAVEKAVRDCGGFKNGRGSYPIFVRRPPTKTFDASAFMAARLSEAEGIGEADIWERSPVLINWPPEQDAVELLARLYDPSDVLFIGDQYSTHVKPVAGWLTDLQAGQSIPPHIIPNPMTGLEALNKNGELSFRCDASVKSFRFAVGEFDVLSREDQLRFWWAVNLPICALIDSGNKSFHAWIKIDGISTTDQWDAQVEEQLFRHYLIPLGCDEQCRTESRLSRLPGHFRTEKKRWQRILYLCPEGRRIKT